MRGLHRLGIAGLFLWLTGCASTSERSSATIARTGDPIVDGNAQIASGPAKDRVLWECRTAAEAMRRAQFGEAKRLLDDALLTIGGRLGNDKSGKKARSYFSEE